MNTFFNGKTAIITGSSGGIGRTTASEFLKLGANVVINGRNPDKLEKTRQEFQSQGFEVLAIAGDVTDPEFCQSVVDKTLEKFQRIDFLINNAGSPMRGRFDEITQDVIKKVTASNFLSAGYFTKAALEELKKTKGAVVFISSLAAIHGLPNASIYSATKLALKGLAEGLRIELFRTGVHVSYIEVGLTENDPEKMVIGKDGKPINIKGGTHHSQKDVANAIIKSIKGKKFRKTLTPAGIFFRSINWISPKLVSMILSRTQFSAKYK